MNLPQDIPLEILNILQEKISEWQITTFAHFPKPEGYAQKFPVDELLFAASQLGVLKSLGDSLTHNLLLFQNSEGLSLIHAETGFHGFANIPHALITTPLLLAPDPKGSGWTPLHLAASLPKGMSNIPIELLSPEILNLPVNEDTDKRIWKLALKEEKTLCDFSTLPRESLRKILTVEALIEEAWAWGPKSPLEELERMDRVTELEGRLTTHTLKALSAHHKTPEKARVWIQKELRKVETIYSSLSKSQHNCL